MEHGIMVAPAVIQNEHLPLVAQSVTQGQCILFLGAGAHSLPPAGSPFQYDAASAPPRGGDLSAILASESSYVARYPGADPRDLRRVALHYQQVKGRKALADRIVELVSKGRQPSPMLRALAQLDFRLIITTNYDQLIESAFAAAGKPCRQSVYTPASNVPSRRLGDLDPARPYLLKIHGDVDDAASLVVTQEDYIHFVLRMRDYEVFNPVPLGVRHWLTQWPILFVGYSLGDFNLRLLLESLFWGTDPSGVPRSFCVDPEPDAMLVRVLSDPPRIVFIAQDVWSFVPAMYDAMGRRLTV